MDYENFLLQKKLILPEQKTNNFYQEKQTIELVRQLDITLMSIGFKLSPNVMTHLNGLDTVNLFKLSNKILDSVRELIGDHVKHNTYFKQFPNNVPSNEEFWFNTIIKNFFFGIIDYGIYNHTYDEMLSQQEELIKDNKNNFKIINLGKKLNEEITQLYSDLTKSNVLLNKNDRELLRNLVSDQHCSPSLICPLRENRAIIFAELLRNNKTQYIQVDTLTDILRIACELSDGDVTLNENTKFKSMKRGYRRFLLGEIHRLVTKNKSKIDDAIKYREQFKKLLYILHPYEYPCYCGAIELYQVLNKDIKHKTWGSRLQESFNNNDYYKVIRLLSDKPGVLIRHVDKVIRECDKHQFDMFVETLKENIHKVNRRVLLSLKEHLNNRDISVKIYINKNGKSYVKPNQYIKVDPYRLLTINNIIDNILCSDIPNTKYLFIHKDLLENEIALPLTEKTKSEGFDVLPRGSIVSIENSDLIRFFVYWKQKEKRTDYDLSVAFYDDKFNLLNHLSWDSIKTVDGVHSGDIISAPDGASEFIDINIKSLSKNIKYIIPTINVFSGEKFNEVEECFFGFMNRNKEQKGKPFEASTVKTKFTLNGTGQVALPLVFYIKNNKILAKWLDIYTTGKVSCNTVNSNKMSSILQAKTMIEKKFITINHIVSLYTTKADYYKFIDDEKDIPKDVPVTYFGMRTPEGLHEKSKIYSLNNFKELV